MSSVSNQNIGRLCCIYSYTSVKFFLVIGTLLQNVNLQGKVATDILFCPSSEFCEDQGFHFLDDVTTFSFYFEMRYKEVINPKHYSTTIIDTSILRIFS